MALSQGFHRDAAKSTDDGDEEDRYRSAWWTVYILDRKLSSLMGAPSSIHDGDVSVQLPQGNQSTQQSFALSKHIELSRLIAKILNSEYLWSPYSGHIRSTHNVYSCLRHERGVGFIFPEFDTRDVKRTSCVGYRAQLGRSQAAIAHVRDAGPLLSSGKH